MCVFLRFYEKTDSTLAIVRATPSTYLNSSIGRIPSELLLQAALESYKLNYETFEGIHAMCEDYRASAPGGIDLTLDAADRKIGKKIKAPLRVLWGEKGVIGSFHPIKEWQEVSEKEVTGRSVPTGHYIPEG
jgi:haloacetate dehalogenase